MMRTSEVIECKCGNIFAICADGYQDEEWTKNKKEYLEGGCKVYVTQDDILHKHKRCVCPKTLEQQAERCQMNLFENNSIPDLEPDKDQLLALALLKFCINPTRENALYLDEEHVEPSILARLNKHQQDKALIEAKDMLIDLTFQGEANILRALREYEKALCNLKGALEVQEGVAGADGLVHSARINLAQCTSLIKGFYKGSILSPPKF